MFDQIFVLLAAALPALMTIYWISLIVGGGLLLISTLAGGDTDLDLDIDTDASVDGHAEAGHAQAASLASWFSMQFVVFFMAMFGLIGVTLSYLTDSTPGITLAGAAVGGLLVGQGAHQVLRKLRQNSGDSTPRPDDYVNKLARVTVVVADGKTGEVALRVGRADRYVPAVAKHAKDTFNSGQQVGVVAYHDGVVDVVSREEYEFLNEKS